MDSRDLVIEQFADDEGALLDRLERETGDQLE